MSEEGVVGSGAVDGQDKILWIRPIERNSSWGSTLPPRHRPRLGPGSLTTQLFATTSIVERDTAVGAVVLVAVLAEDDFDSFAAVLRRQPDFGVLTGVTPSDTAMCVDLSFAEGESFILRVPWGEAYSTLARTGVVVCTRGLSSMRLARPGGIEARSYVRVQLDQAVLWRGLLR